MTAPEIIKKEERPSHSVRYLKLFTVIVKYRILASDLQINWIEMKTVESVHIFVN